MLLKQISKGKSQAPTVNILENLPGYSYVSDLISKTKPKQVFDVVIFSVGIYCVYTFGKQMSEKLESFVPTEQDMLEMMKEMQA